MRLLTDLQAKAMRREQKRPRLRVTRLNLPPYGYSYAPTALPERPRGEGTPLPLPRGPSLPPRFSLPNWEHCPEVLIKSDECGNWPYPYLVDANSSGLSWEAYALERVSYVDNMQ